MRSAMPHPCMGASARDFKISRSSVPCNRSVDSGILPLVFRHENFMHSCRMSRGDASKLVCGNCYFVHDLVLCNKSCNLSCCNFFTIREQMTKRDYLGNFELIVMLALMRLREDAYGVPISREIEERI